MITDTNSVVTFLQNTFLGMAGGDIVFLGILLFLGIGIALIYGKARASSVVLVGVSIVFMLSLLMPSVFGWLFWLSILASVFILINGLRKWIQGY